jgi:hypothetical protein
MSLICAISAGRVRDEPWAITPKLGISGYYYTNPTLASNGGSAFENVAALVDLPVTYDADALEILVRPSGRLGNEKGYYSLASNYAHLDSSLQYSTDLSSTTLQGEVARDSSLYFGGGLNNGIGVRRDSKAASADWTRSITERAQFQLDASWSEVQYNQTANETGLTDYRYITAGPTFGYSFTERDTLQIIGNAARYQSLDGISESKSGSLQLGYVRQLDELWKLTVNAGYSRATNSEKVYFTFFGFQFYLGTYTTNQDGGIYSVNLTRQAEQFTFAGTVSRVLQPTGFAFLSRQDAVSFTTTYKQSERWDYGLTFTWQEAQTPEFQGEVFNERYLNSQLSANWHWTERWTLQLQANRIAQHYGPPAITAASNGVNLSIYRQFLRTDL